MGFDRPDRKPATTARARSFRRRMTCSEQQLWKELRKLNANFRRQAPIGRYFADFAAHGRKLVIEVDGGVHERLAEVAARDLERQRWLEGEGYTVLRFSDRQISEDLDRCVETVKAHVGVAWEGSAPASASVFSSLHSPPSPTLPPSRRKGA